MPVGIRLDVHNPTGRSMLDYYPKKKNQRGRVDKAAVPSIVLQRCTFRNPSGALPPPVTRPTGKKRPKAWKSVAGHGLSIVANGKCKLELKDACEVEDGVSRVKSAAATVTISQDCVINPEFRPAGREIEKLPKETV